MKPKRIIFCTLRDNRGATGGPGGVLFIQKSVLGEEINGLPCRYIFNYITLRLGPLKIPINKWLFSLKFKRMKDAYFFTHDIDTGALLARLGKPYSLLYHHQGPLIEEWSNFGLKLSEGEKRRMERTEKIALTNALSLHFPSNGAAEMYFTSKLASCHRENVNLGIPFYNIIPQVNPTKPDDFGLEYDHKKITLFSLGTLTAAKGQDLTVAFIRKFAKAISKPIRYILVGKGPLKEKLIAELEEIKKDVPSFTYYYYASLSHDTVMYVHKISDIYIMLHRISIFDFATLEAMSQHSAIVLSKIGGNLDFDKNSNVIFAEDAERDLTLLTEANITSLKERNFDVFCRYFSKKAFIDQYKSFFKVIFSN